MKEWTKLVILATVFLAVCIPLVSAWNVEDYTIDPSGSLNPNTSVNVSFNVLFPANTSEMTFPMGSDLVMTTDLVNPTWSYTVSNGNGGSDVTPDFNNQTLDLSGFILSYKGTGSGHNSEMMKVTLTGTAPIVSTPTSKTMLNVYEVDKTGNVVTSSQVTQTAVISQGGLLDQIIRMLKSLFGIQF
ncbi:hypothetical protein [Methanoregula sp.]|jgi:hypothetical protein|uniref:hypothetical protein n=1 Tax=Methanoregula sp. TaxID=2052170 RepID=UPI003C2A80DB